MHTAAPTAPALAPTALAATVLAGLRAQGQTLAIAESCTGGLIGHLLTSVPGASAVFLGSAVVYANSAKAALLGVDPQVLAAHGAVSAPVVAAMAAGARARYGADWAVATSGIAGPDGGSTDKPVGTLWLALAGPQGVETRSACWPGLSRDDFKLCAAEAALAWLAERQAAGAPA